MAYHLEKETGDIVFDEFEQGVAASPHKGIANIQNGNISTEIGEVVTSFARVAQYAPTPNITNGTLTASVGAGADLLAAPSNLTPGSWINISSTTITQTTATVSALVVGAGGGGGRGNSSAGFPPGAGGAGQFQTVSGKTVSVGSAYPITIGAGGTGALSNTSGGKGASTIFDTTTSIGGGGGGAGFNTGGGGGASDLAGASGGGGDITSSSGVGGIASTGQNGGAGNITSNGGGGGGGGSTGVGGAASNHVGGNGGAGTASSITGSSVTYAGGGGGGVSTGGVAGTGGAGGGGAGGVGTGSGTAGTANRGAGGGGGGVGGTAGNGGDGGTGVVIISYPTANMTATGGSITTSGSNTIHTFTTSGTFTVTAVLITIATGNYYVSYKNGSNQVTISSGYDATGNTPLAHGTTGTATFSTIVKNIGRPIAKATEEYSDGSTVQYRYYILDSNSFVWLYDTGVYNRTLTSSGVGTTWFLPDISDYSGNLFTGMAILNGWLLVLNSLSIYGKPTSDLGRAFAALTNVGLMNPFVGHTNYAFVGHQGTLNYTDGNYIGQIFPDTSTVSGTTNVQSYAQYTAATTTGTITALIGGALPYSGGIRIPAVFYTDANGVQPTNLTAGTVYYIAANAGSGVFQVFAALSDGSAIDVAAGASGNQFFDTFFPISADSGASGTHALMTFTPQRLNLPFFEVAQSIVEVGNIILIGCIGSVVYPWNQIDATPSSLINLPESNVKTMITVNQMAYIFPGNKGNVYITDGSVASQVISVPDYAAGVPGTPSSYVEPSFTWGDAMYIRGRVYFTILDQTTTKAGNCGGVWSFVPTQNLYIGQDTGIALRIEARNSYNTYNGVATVLLPSQTQNSSAPLYWAGWYSSVSAPTYGIDYSSTTTVSPTIIDTDAVPVGTLLNKKTFERIEFKVASPLLASDTVAISYRQDLTSAWKSCGTVKLEANRLSGYFSANFEKNQWLQLQSTATPGTTNSFIRLKEIRIH